jgi:hypothetical protein
MLQNALKRQSSTLDNIRDDEMINVTELMSLVNRRAKAHHWDGYGPWSEDEGMEDDQDEEEIEVRG